MQNLLVRSLPHIMLISKFQIFSLLRLNPFQLHCFVCAQMRVCCAQSCVYQALPLLMRENIRSVAVCLSIVCRVSVVIFRWRRRWWVTRSVPPAYQTIKMIFRIDLFLFKVNYVKKIWIVCVHTPFLRGGGAGDVVVVFFLVVCV